MCDDTTFEYLLYLFSIFFADIPYFNKLRGVTMSVELPRKGFSGLKYLIIFVDE